MQWDGRDVESPYRYCDNHAIIDNEWVIWMAIRKHPILSLGLVTVFFERLENEAWYVSYQGLWEATHYRDFVLAFPSGVGNQWTGTQSGPIIVRPVMQWKQLAGIVTIP